MATKKPPVQSDPNSQVTTPEAVARPSTPTAYGMGDHSFTLQAIMEMQKSLGEMKASLDGMKSSIDSVKSKVDDLVNWKHKILGGVAVIAVVATLLGFLISKFSDYVTIKPPTPAPTSLAPAQDQPPAPVDSKPHGKVK